MGSGENHQQTQGSSSFDNTSSSREDRSSVRGAFNSLDTNSRSLQAGLPSAQQLPQQLAGVLNQNLSCCISNAVAQALLPQNQLMQQQQQMLQEQQQQLAHLQRQLSVQSSASSAYGRPSVMISTQSAKPASSSPQQLSARSSAFRLPGVSPPRSCLLPSICRPHLPRKSPKHIIKSPERAVLPAKVAAVFERQIQRDHVLNAIAHIEAQGAGKGDNNVTPAPHQHLTACDHTVAAPAPAPFEDTCMAGIF